MRSLKDCTCFPSFQCGYSYDKTSRNELQHSPSARAASSKKPPRSRVIIHHFSRKRSLRAALLVCACTNLTMTHLRARREFACFGTLVNYSEKRARETKEYEIRARKGERSVTVVNQGCGTKMGAGGGGGGSLPRPWGPSVMHRVAAAIKDAAEA